MEATLEAAISAAVQQPDWDEGEDEYDEDEYDAEAEEIAKRLGDQLWADIAKAQAEASAHSSTMHVPSGHTAHPRTQEVGNMNSQQHGSPRRKY